MDSFVFGKRRKKIFKYKNRIAWKIIFWRKLIFCLSSKTKEFFFSSEIKDVKTSDESILNNIVIQRPFLSPCFFC